VMASGTVAGDGGTPAKVTLRPDDGIPSRSAERVTAYTSAGKPLSRYELCSRLMMDVDGEVLSPDATEDVLPLLRRGATST
jgi:hypothetical protein